MGQILHEELEEDEHKRLFTANIARVDAHPKAPKCGETPKQVYALGGKLTAEVHSAFSALPTSRLSPAGQ